MGSMHAYLPIKIENKVPEIKATPIPWIQIILVLVFIFSRYWSKSIIRAPPAPTFTLKIRFSFRFA